MFYRFRFLGRLYRLSAFYSTKCFWHFYIVDACSEATYSLKSEAVDDELVHSSLVSSGQRHCNLEWVCEIWCTYLYLNLYRPSVECELCDRIMSKRGVLHGIESTSMTNHHENKTSATKTGAVLKNRSNIDPNGLLEHLPNGLLHLFQGISNRPVPQVGKGCME